MSLAPSVAVIGGGISGPVTAIALEEADIPATVFEAAAGPDDAPAGTIAIEPNGVAALAAVGAERPCSITPTRWPTASWPSAASGSRCPASRRVPPL